MTGHGPYYCKFFSMVFFALIWSSRIRFCRDNSKRYRRIYMALRDQILKPGTQAPEFNLLRTPDQRLSLSELRGQPVVLIFYPADWSPVCGDELALFNELLSEFKEYDVQLVGISVDQSWCHVAYSKDRNLRYPLIADFEPKGE